MQWPLRSNWIFVRGVTSARLSRYKDRSDAQKHLSAMTASFESVVLTRSSSFERSSGILRL